MANEDLFIDTAFAQAYINPRDHYHKLAEQLYIRMLQATRIVTTEAVLMEIADALSRLDREKAAKFIKDFRNSPNAQVVSVDTALFDRGLTLYASRSDKTWGLTDCISFVVMEDNALTLALTADRHFVQAGFRALLLETT